MQFLMQWLMEDLQKNLQIESFSSFLWRHRTCGTGNPGAVSEFLQPFISESIGAEALIDISPILGRGGETTSE